MITEDHVVEAYRRKLQLERRAHITRHTDPETETPAQFEELLETRDRFAVIEMHYTDQETS